MDVVNGFAFIKAFVNINSELFNIAAAIISINEMGIPEVKATSIDSLTVEVGSYDVSYINRDFKGINSVGEAIDVILEDLPQLANDLVIEEEELVLKSVNDDELANVPLTSDEDINDIIDSLDI